MEAGVSAHTSVAPIRQPKAASSVNAAVQQPRAVPPEAASAADAVEQQPKAAPKKVKKKAAAPKEAVALGSLHGSPAEEPSSSSSSSTSRIARRGKSIREEPLLEPMVEEAAAQGSFSKALVSTVCSAFGVGGKIRQDKGPAARPALKDTELFSMEDSSSKAASSWQGACPAKSDAIEPLAQSSALELSHISEASDADSLQGSPRGSPAPDAQVDSAENDSATF